jgi:hypothetical protein
LEKELNHFSWATVLLSSSSKIGLLIKAAITALKTPEGYWSRRNFVFIRVHPRSFICVDLRASAVWILIPGFPSYRDIGLARACHGVR